MSPDSAQILLLAITVVAAVVWMVGVQFLLVSARTKKPDDLVASENSLTGSVEVDGQANLLADKAASMIAKGVLGPVKITEKTADRIGFERFGLATRNQPWFQRAELRFTQVRQGRSRIEWAVELSNRTWLLWLGGLFQVLGLLALVAGGWAIYTFVISSPNPAVRWQTLQMLQVSHFLWPPFLMGGLYRQGMKQAAAQFEALANNLPYYGE